MYNVLQVYLLLRFPVYGLFLDFWETSTVLAAMGYLISGYCVCYQFFCHTLIALNRFTVFAFPQTHKKVSGASQLCAIVSADQAWNRKKVRWIVLLNMLLPLPFLAFRVPARVEYFYTGPNMMGARYTDANIRFVSWP